MVDLPGEDAANESRGLTESDLSGTCAVDHCHNESTTKDEGVVTYEVSPPEEMSQTHESGAPFNVVGREHGPPVCDELIPYLAALEKLDLENEDDDCDGVRTLATFHWNHGGNEIYLLCSEDGVEKKFKMIRNGNSFMLLRYIPKTVYSYTYLVDGVECHAPDQPFKNTPNGIRNFVDCCNVSFEGILSAEDEDQADETYDHRKPCHKYLVQEPPQMPSALLYRSPDFDDGDRVANDIHIMANHIYQDTHSNQIFGPNYRSFITVYRWERKINDIVKVHNSVSLIYVTKAPQQVEESGDSTAAEWFKVIK